MRGKHVLWLGKVYLEADVGLSLVWFGVERILLLKLGEHPQV